MVGPMVGLSHVAFRALIRSYLPTDFPALLFSEMLSSRRLPSERLEAVEHLKTMDNEKYLIPQILGNEEKFIVPSVQKLMGLNPSGIDINMGCPTTHTLKHNWGVLLMGDKKYAREVVRITKQASPVPVSVKLRAGDKVEDFDYLLDFTSALEKGGADWLTIHARVKEKKHEGPANWDLVGKIAKELSIPVVVNGDIQTWDDALHVQRDCGADGIMVGRAACARPWILAQIAYQLGYPGIEKPPFSLEEEGSAYFQSCLRFADFLIHYFGDSPNTLRRFHFYLTFSSKWFLFGHNLWRSTLKSKSVAEAKSAVATYSQNHPQPMRHRISWW